MARPKKTDPVGDATRTERSARHRERLAQAKGRRVVVDMPSHVVDALDALLVGDYGTTQKDVVCRAVLEVAAKREKKA